jgi:hypothetical protein
MLLGEANREAPAQAELRPTCAGSSRVNLRLILALIAKNRPSRTLSPSGLGAPCLYDKVFIPRGRNDALWQRKLSRISLSS